jgi:glycosyltransferase involved in cell wall biosynthesis
MKLPVSVVLLTHNEENNVRDCLDSCCGFAQEIVVVDDASTDKTLEIVKEYEGVKVFHRSLDGDFGAQKNFGIKQATQEWVFLIDADERVTPQLEMDIRNCVHAKEKCAYWVQRDNYFKNMVAHHGTMRPSWVLRLLPREGASVDGKVHETVRSTFPQKRIPKGRLNHYSYHSWDQFYAKMDHYASLSAAKFAQEGRPCGFMSHVVISPIWAFFKVYILNLGFLDGKAGFIFAASHYAYTLSKYVRYYQLKHFDGVL